MFVSIFALLCCVMHCLLFVVLCFVIYVDVVCWFLLEMSVVCCDVLLQFTVLLMFVVSTLHC